MKPNPESGKDQTLAGATAALRRAATRARMVARRTGTPLVISKDGRVEKQWLQGDAEAGGYEDPEKSPGSVPPARR